MDRRWTSPLPTETLLALALLQLVTAQAPATFGDYSFAVPDGWTTMPNGANLWVVSPPSETGERCTISLWPMRAPRGTDLLTDANYSWSEIFHDFAVPPGAAARFVRATAAQGWEYAVVRRDMAPPGSPDATLTAFVMLVRLGDHVATITWLSKAQLYSTCIHVYTGLPKVWPRFFASLGFKGWTAGASGFAQGVTGSWESFGSSTGGGAVLQYAFTPAGRYAFTGVGQRYMALSRFEAAVWTSTTFGDGAYAVRGNELTLRPDRGDAEVYVVRLERESTDGRTWSEKLYLMRPERVTYLDGSRIEDNEVGLTRMPQ